LAASGAKDEWVLRVLGVEVRSAAAKRRALVTPIWNEAKDAVDRALDALCTAVKDFDDPLTEQLVHAGLPSVTGRLVTPLMAALLSYDKNPSEDEARAVLPRLESMRAFLATDRVVALIEDNPFGVAAGVKEPLLGALARIEASLR
jgi:hypothetical protein